VERDEHVRLVGDSVVVRKIIMVAKDVLVILAWVRLTQLREARSTSPVAENSAELREEVVDVLEEPWLVAVE
jgi:hypothetical protein